MINMWDKFSFVYRPKTKNTFNYENFPFNFLTTKLGTPNLKGIIPLKQNIS